jgi:hypothetical protein
VKIQPSGFHEFGCRVCGCIRDSLDYARFKYDKRKEEPKQMSLVSKYNTKSQGASNDFLPWLKSENLDEDGTIFVVTDVRESTTQFSDILMDVKNGREEFTVGIKGESVLLSQLVQVLGDNEKNWNGKKVKLYLAKGRYINAGDPKAKAKEAKRPSKAPAKKARKR